MKGKDGALDMDYWNYIQAQMRCTIFRSRVIETTKVLNFLMKTNARIHGCGAKLVFRPVFICYSSAWGRCKPQGSFEIQNGKRGGGGAYKGIARII